MTTDFGWPAPYEVLGIVPGGDGELSTRQEVRFYSNSDVVEIQKQSSLCGGPWKDIPGACWYGSPESLAAAADIVRDKLPATLKDGGRDDK